MAVLLTGFGQDGGTGIAAVRAAGGVTIVQEPSSAAKDQMPLAGIAAGAAEVLPLDEIATRLAA